MNDYIYYGSEWVNFSVCFFLSYLRNGVLTRMTRGIGLGRLLSGIF